MEKTMTKDKKGTTEVVWVKAPPSIGDHMAFSYNGFGMGVFHWGKPVRVPNENVVHLRAMVNDGDFGDWSIGDTPPKKPAKGAKDGDA